LDVFLFERRCQRGMWRSPVTIPLCSCSQWLLCPSKFRVFAKQFNRSVYLKDFFELILRWVIRKFGQVPKNKSTFLWNFVLKYRLRKISPQHVISTAARVVKISSTDDSRQFITPSVHLCTTQCVAPVRLRQLKFVTGLPIAIVCYFKNSKCDHLLRNDYKWLNHPRYCKPEKTIARKL